MRSIKTPLFCLVYKKLNRAVLKPPICNNPVGLGANRVTTRSDLEGWFGLVLQYERKIHVRVEVLLVCLAIWCPLKYPDARLRIEDPRNDVPNMIPAYGQCVVTKPRDHGMRTSGPTFNRL